MMNLRVAIFLSAFVCTMADAHHVQSCSGGPGGGVDATGNQCSAAGHEVDSVPQPEDGARSHAAIAAPVLHLAAPVGSTSVAHATAGPHTTALSKSTDRFARHAKPQSAELPADTAKMGNAQEALCSGGSDGGMDATGNQCNSATPAASIPFVQTSGH
jgi:hypothetical protein